MSNYLVDTFGLEGKVALVAGASSGIGAQFAKALAKAGAKVVLGARRVDRIEALAASIADETGSKTLAVALDVTDRKSVVAAFDKAEEAFGTVTVVCNNAGIAIPNWSLEESEDDWDKTMNTNLKGMWHVAQESGKRMVAAGVGGSIINTASILGLGVGGMQTSYATSKAGVLHMTRSMATELQRFGIRVNAICPGYFKTEINDEFLETELGQNMLKRSPARRAGRLEELEAPMLMLASDAASFVTGVALPVDGAHSVTLP
ncbi:SDR family NAD(P)-dependent oxidoreductase [Kordiimonas aquimaris]|uniref:SDR family NAD(P)-dependent oxidoreductase n=1 Tax=Kordiimonas aquimaris TaxID=707591 RepID=UPI0021D32ED1|nr:SDR family oxidoreductase [Kordiimonas aquimaris]